jgi:hypothetical protein
MKSKSVKSKILCFHGREVNPLQSRLLQHVCTCSNISASDGSTSQTQFLELLTAALCSVGSTSSNLLSRKNLFVSLGKRKESQGAISGEQESCLTCGTLVSKKLLHSLG